MAGLFLISLFMCVPAFIIWHYISLKKKNRQLMAEMEQPVVLPDVDSTYATVLKKDVLMKKNVLSAGKTVRTHQLVYTAQFLTDSGKTVEYSLPEELYDYINIGQKGVLATVDGEFFDFGDGEKISI